MSDDDRTTTIWLRRKTKPRPARSPRTPPPSGGEAVLPIDDETSRYLRRRGEVEITFYDLGTRLQSVAVPSGASALAVFVNNALSLGSPPAPTVGFAVNEYLPLNYEYLRGSPSDQTPFKDPFSSVNSQFDRITRTIVGPLANHPPVYPVQAHTLESGANPFAFSPAVGSERPLPHCMPLPYKAEALDCAAGLGSKIYSLEESEKRWRPRTAQPADATESWNPYSVSTGVAFNPGRLVVPIQKATNFGFGGATYLAFGNSPEFRATLTFDPRGPDVLHEIVIKAGQKIRVFLRPMSFWFYRSGQVPSTIYGRVGRAPVYPQLSSIEYVAGYQGLASAYKFVPDSLHRGGRETYKYFDPLGGRADAYGFENAIYDSPVWFATPFAFVGAMEITRGDEKKLYFFWTGDGFPQMRVVPVVAL
ncbi:MAG: hypothetical protein H0W76_01465 [Pyrinomonadaceae bacterium]|nr:hypothetical protein [Pyrinomonadaceae bacterium]